jgi:hypothetical protein
MAKKNNRRLSLRTKADGNRRRRHRRRARDHQRDRLRRRVHLRRPAQGQPGGGAPGRVYAIDGFDKPWEQHYSVGPSDKYEVGQLTAPAIAVLRQGRRGSTRSAPRTRSSRYGSRTAAAESGPRHLDELLPETRSRRRTESCEPRDRAPRPAHQRQDAEDRRRRRPRKASSSASFEEDEDEAPRSKGNGSAKAAGKSKTNSPATSPRRRSYGGRSPPRRAHAPSRRAISPIWSTRRTRRIPTRRP